MRIAVDSKLKSFDGFAEKKREVRKTGRIVAHVGVLALGESVCLSWSTCEGAKVTFVISRS